MGIWVPCILCVLIGCRDMEVHLGNGMGCAVLIVLVVFLFTLIHDKRTIFATVPVE